VRSHQWIDRRSLALHRVVADKIESDPALLDLARQNVKRWLSSHRAPALVEWEHLLDTRPVGDIVGILRAADENATRLRQSSPFAGVLSASERRAVLEQYDARRA
jgi:hypothetical protein